MNQKLLWKIEELWEKYYKPGKGGTPEIRSVHFKQVHEFSFESSLKIIHQDEYGSYLGLANQQVIFQEKPIYLFDNHNKIIFALYEYFVENGSFDVVHIDAHRDDALYSHQKPAELAPDTIKVFVDTTRISDFFDAISNTQMVSKIHRVCDSGAFLDYKNPEKPFVLSLDIDIFGPEGDFTSLEEKIRVIASAWGRAGVVCIATSPGFIDQDFARDVIETFVKK